MARVFHGPDLSRAQRRRIEALAPEVDRIVEADRRYFERFPRRSHRLRLLSRAELEQLAIASGKDALLPATQEWACCVRQVSPGARLRRFLVIAKGGDLDQPEGVCRAIFDRLTGGSKEAAQVEAALRAAAGGVQ